MSFSRWLRRKLDNINPDNNARVTFDPGDTSNVLLTSGFDKAINLVEKIEGGVANVGAGANLAAIGAAKAGLPLVPYAGRVVTGVASKFEPIQAGLWAIDAARSLTDAEYRKRHYDALRLLEKGEDKRRLDGRYFNTTAALQTFEHPVSTGGALMKYAQEAIQDRYKHEKKDAEVKLKVENARIQKQRELLDLAKYLNQNSASDSASNINSALAIKTAQKYFK